MSRKKKPAPEEREIIDPTLTTEPEVVVEDWQEEQRFDRSLRPHDLNDYIGQEGVKQNLRIAIEAARQRGDVLDHLLFCGPPGLGKTSLAHIIAREMGVAIRATTGPVIERPGDLAAILTNLDAGDVLFIDEIHRLNRVVEEILYRSASILALPIDASGTTEIARRARGTPRIANRLLRRVRDFAQVKAEPVVTREVARAALALLEVDEAGFDKMDRAILLTIIDKFSGGPVGVETIAAAIGEEKSTIEDVYEPYLLQEGYLQRTPRGRVATVQAYLHFGIPRPGEVLQGRLL